MPRLLEFLPLSGIDGPRENGPGSTLLGAAGEGTQYVTTSRIAGATIVAFLLSSSSVVTAGSNHGAAANSIPDEYLIIQRALAEDSTEGVVEASSRIVEVAHGLDLPAASAEQGARSDEWSRSVMGSARALQSAGNLPGMRQEFKTLSQYMVTWARKAEPSGIAVIQCSMAPGTWLQEGAKVHNPYYGAKMSRCGEVLSDWSGPRSERRAPAADPHAGSAGSHSDAGLPGR